MLPPSRIALAFLLAGACLHAQKLPTTTVLSTMAPSTVAAGQQVLLHAAVVDANGYFLATSGTIQFLDGATILGQPIAAPAGIASLNVSLSAGNHTLRAQFSGDTGLATSASGPLTQTVVANACPQLVFAQSPAPAAAGANLGSVTVQVVCGTGVSTVTLTAQGLGSFKPGGTATAPVVNGSAVFNNLALTTPGAYTLAASAPGAAGAVSNTFTIAPAAPASVFTVSNTQDDGAGSFRDAFNQANIRGGVITFQTDLSGTVALASPLPQIVSDLEIIGPGPRVLTLSGSSQVRLLFIESGNVTVSGVTISDGVAGSSIADAYGPGIENISSSPVAIDNCVVTNNSTPVLGSFGGGIHNKGTMSVTNSTISYNRSGSGGGIDNGGILTIGNSLILGNVSAFGSGGGGGIVNETGATLTIANSTLYGNTAAESGGGIINQGALSIADSSLTRNEAHGSDGVGGALFNQGGGTASIVRSTISANVSIHDGGGIANTTNSTVTVVNSTIASNSAVDNGGALVNRATATTSLVSSTLYGNTGMGGGGIYNEGNGSQLSLKNSIVAGNANSLTSAPDDCAGCGGVSAGNLIGSDPKLGALQSNGGPTQTMLPLPGSPVIGAGGASAAVTTDQRGQTRPAAGSVDYGAVQTSYGLAFAPQPQNGAQGAPITAGVQLQESGRVFAPAANLPLGGNSPLPFTATLALASGTGKLTGNVVNVDAGSGVAQFPALQVDTLGTKTLKAAVPGFASATSQPFTISVLQIVPAAIVVTAGNGQSAPVNSDFATALQVVVRDASGAGLPGITLVFTAVSGARFGGGSPTTVAITDASGLATATSLTAGSAPGPATVTVNIPGNPLQATFNLTVTPTPAAPAITAAGFLNDASFLPTTAAPNTIMAAFGTFPCSNSVALLVNGKAAEILSASGGQVNFTMPGSLAGTSAATVQAVCGTLVSQSIQLQAGASAPGVFTLTQNGKGQAAALNQNGLLNSALSPAGAGQIISLYVTGLGPFNAAGADGLQHMSLPIQAFLGGTQATVLYAGNAPGYTPGLQQVNIMVPAGVSGLATPLTLAAGGINSQAGVTLAIQ
jgi:uncharacterized protein (TIGR03437 family)